MELGLAGDLDFSLDDLGSTWRRLRNHLDTTDETANSGPGIPSASRVGARRVVDVVRHHRRLEISGAFDPDSPHFLLAKAWETNLSDLAESAGTLWRSGLENHDPRLLNTALKALGGALHLVALRRDTSPNLPIGGASDRGVLAILDDVVAAVDRSSHLLPSQAGRRARFAGTRGPDLRPGHVAFLYPSASRTAPKVRAMVPSSVPHISIAWTPEENRAPFPRVEFDRAYYPGRRHPFANVVLGDLPDRPALVARSWSDLVRHLRNHRPAHVVMIGMPIVPMSVLESFPGTFLNVHNGSLPNYRGMDAVGWALWNQDKIVVTSHTCSERVDAGAVVQEIQIPMGADLKGAVSRVTAQLAQDAIVRLATDDEVPTLVPGPGHPDSHSHFRLHATLRRVLDRRRPAVIRHHS